MTVGSRRDGSREERKVVQWSSEAGVRGVGAVIQREEQLMIFSSGKELHWSGVSVSISCSLALFRSPPAAASEALCQL